LGFPRTSYARETYEQGRVHRFLAEIQYELLQRHGFIVDRDEQMAKLGEEELELLVGELAQLVAENILDTDVVCIPPGPRVNISFAPD
jgi:hypothetical protein